MKTKIRFMACVCACLLSLNALSQCLPVINDTAACNGTEPLVANNEIIGAGTTRWFHGTAATFTSLSIQTGGKLIVCGELQVNAFSMQGGTLVITRSGRLTVNSGSGSSMVFTGGCAVYNLGFFKVLCNLVLDGPDAWNNPAQPNIMWNGPGAHFEMPHTYFVLEKGNCFFVNKGIANFSGIITNTLADSASVCLGNFSRMYVSLLENKHRLTYVAPEGPACVFIRSWGFSVEQLTEWPSVFLCRSASYCVGGCDSIARQNQKWGVATLFNSCTSCAGMYLLPTHFSDFQLRYSGSSMLLSWTVNTIPPQAQFIVQRSHDGISFQNAAVITANEEKSTSYTYSDKAPLKGKSFYRILLTSSGSNHIVSKVLSAGSGDDLSMPQVLPNPFKNECTILLPKSVFVQEIKLIAPTGETVHRQVMRRQTNRIHIQPGIVTAAGTYFVQIITNEKTFNLRLIKD